MMTALPNKPILLDPATQQLPERTTIEQLAAQEIEQQLEDLPHEIVKLINQASALAYVLNCLSPLSSTLEEEWYWQQKQVMESIKEMISEAATLSLIRFLGTSL